MKKKILIIEDEITIREEIFLLLGKRDEFQIIASCDSVASSLQTLQQQTPDLILMDIELTDGKSFEILETLDSIPFKIMFITAYDHFAIRAIKFGALDYLLKPIDEEELNEALDKYLAHTLDSQSFSYQKAQLDFFTNQYAQGNHNTSKITLKTLHEVFFVNIHDISYCKGEGSYTTFYLLEHQEITVSKPLKEYEELLPKAQFLRTHKSYLVNMEKIKSFNQDGFVVLEGKAEVPVSVRKKESILHILSQR